MAAIGHGMDLEPIDLRVRVLDDVQFLFGVGTGFPVVDRPGPERVGLDIGRQGMGVDGDRYWCAVTGRTRTDIAVMNGRIRTLVEVSGCPACDRGSDFAHNCLHS